MDKRGHFNTPRDIVDDPIFKNSRLYHVYSWCRLKAGYKDERYVGIGNQKVRLTKNQFIFGTFKAEEELRIPRTTIWRYLRILEKRQKVGIKTTNKYSIITVICPILNNPKWKTNGKQMGTTNNVDNVEQQESSLREEEKDIRLEEEAEIWRELKEKESRLREAKENNQSQLQIDLLTDNIKELKRMLIERWS